MDFAELSTLAKEGKPLYGETNETPYNQGVAFRNSVFSQLKLGQFSLGSFVSLEVLTFLFAGAVPWSVLV